MIVDWLPIEEVLRWIPMVILGLSLAFGFAFSIKTNRDQALEDGLTEQLTASAGDHGRDISWLMVIVIMLFFTYGLMLSILHAPLASVITCASLFCLSIFLARLLAGYGADCLYGFFSGFAACGVFSTLIGIVLILT